MASLTKRKVNGKIYYYLVESQRINGKPRLVKQKYLGRADQVVGKQLFPFSTSFSPSIYIVSDGTGRPYRIKVRSPSFAHYQLFPKMTAGAVISDVIAMIGSLNIIAGELDR